MYILVDDLKFWPDRLCVEDVLRLLHEYGFSDLDYPSEDTIQIIWEYLGYKRLFGAIKLLQQPVGFVTRCREYGDLIIYYRSRGQLSQGETLKKEWDVCPLCLWQKSAWKKDFWTEEFSREDPLKESATLKAGEARASVASALRNMGRTPDYVAPSLSPDVVEAWLKVYEAPWSVLHRPYGVVNDSFATGMINLQVNFNIPEQLRKVILSHEYRSGTDWNYHITEVDEASYLKVHPIRLGRYNSFFRILHFWWNGPGDEWDFVADLSKKYAELLQKLEERIGKKVIFASD